MLTNISGFPEFLPKYQICFNYIVKIIQNKFEEWGFSPMMTSAIEKTSTLLAKGNDHEIYGIHRLAEEAGSLKRDLGLRFDLTVPLARYISQNHGSLTFPYRRYQIAPVWRGERPQAGRYREFYQADVDIVNSSKLSTCYDAEMIGLIYEVLTSISLENFLIKINNRKILTNILRIFEISENNIQHIMRLLDKLPSNNSLNNVNNNVDNINSNNNNIINDILNNFFLSTISYVPEYNTNLFKQFISWVSNNNNINNNSINISDNDGQLIKNTNAHKHNDVAPNDLLNFINQNLRNNDKNNDRYNIINNLHQNNEQTYQAIQEAVEEINTVIAITKLFNVPSHYIKFDPLLVRGLNYYTGTIYETILMDHREIGSICSGGKYSDLVGNIYQKDNNTNNINITKEMEGIGLSIGISRIMSTVIPKLIQDGKICDNKETMAQILVTIQDPKFQSEYILIARMLRMAGIKTEIYFQDKPLKTQMKYANKKGFKFTIIASSIELERGKVILHNMLTGLDILLNKDDINTIVEIVMNNE